MAWLRLPYTDRNVRLIKRTLLDMHKEASPMCTAYGTCICGEVRRETVTDKSKQRRVDGLEWAWMPILVM